jgi:hypothetical protein
MHSTDFRQFVQYLDVPGLDVSRYYGSFPTTPPELNTFLSLFSLQLSLVGNSYY